MFLQCGGCFARDHTASCKVVMHFHWPDVTVFFIQSLRRCSPTNGQSFLLGAQLRRAKAEPGRSTTAKLYGIEAIRCVQKTTAFSNEGAAMSGRGDDVARM